MIDKQWSVIQGNAYVEITSKCNLHCPYCYNDSTKFGKTLSFDIIKELMKYLISCRVNTLAISGGEPFMNESIYDIIKYAKKIGIHLYIITNASLLTTDVLNYLQPYMDILKFQFTFDGQQEETHACSRGKENYRQVENCVLYMLNNGYINHFFLRYNIMNYNTEEIIAFVKKYASMGCRNISFSYILSQGRAKKSTLLVEEGKRRKIYQDICLCRAKYPDVVLKYEEKPVITCPYSITQENQIVTFLPRIDCDGNVYPCQVEVDPKFILGNLHQFTLGQILHSKNFFNYINYVTDKAARNPGCSTCAIHYICGGGCIAIQSSCSAIKAELLHDFLNFKGGTL